MDPLDQPIAEMIGHEIDITVSCGCTRVISVNAAWLIDKLGRDATLRMGEAKMRCRTCKQRPKLTVEHTWATAPIRDKRRDPAPLPWWVVELLEGPSRL